MGERRDFAVNPCDDLKKKKEGKRMFEEREKGAVPGRVLGVYEWKMKRAKEQKCLHAILKSNLNI